jgi:hypothetical protein
VPTDPGFVLHEISLARLRALLAQAPSMRVNAILRPVVII